MLELETDLFTNLNEYFHKEKIDIIIYDKDSFSIEKLKKEDIIIISDIYPRNHLYNFIIKIKQALPLTTVILLMDKPREEDIIYYLELGFDECFYKNFNPRLMLTKIRCIKRKNYFIEIPKKTNSQKVIYSQKWDLKIDPDNRTVTSQGKEIPFTKTEFEILKFLIENSGIIKTREAIVNNIKPLDSDSFERTIDSQICKIRQKLSAFGNLNNIIKTIRGIGYLFSEK